MFLSTAAVLATLAASAAAKDGRTFAVNHFYGKGPLVEGRMDPIVAPGKASSHVHSIQGGNAFAETLSDTALMSSTCTSSLIKNDKSVYWTPKMYFQDPTTGKFEDVPMFYMNVYYFFEATDDDIVAFPQGLRMFVGNAELRTPPSTGGQQILDPASGNPIQPVQFTCPRSNYNPPSYPANSDGMHGVGMQDPNNQGAGSGFPDVNCDGYASPLRADIHFPSCYNPAAGLDDYQNNMAWPSSAGASGGKSNCPAGYIHTPHIFYEVYWNTPLFVDRWTQGQGTQPFVLSNGDNTGYSLHADFIAGWDVPTLQQIIDNCDAGDSGMDKCPGLIGGINDASTSCNIVSAVNEPITGVLDALPGNNPVTGWGTNGAAPAAPVSSSAAGAAPASSGSASSVDTGGYSGAPSSAAASSPSSAASPVHTQGTSTSTAAGAGYTAPGAGSGSGSASSSAAAPVAPISSAPGSDSGYGSGSSPAASSSAAAAPAPASSAAAPASGSSSGSGPDSGSACSVVTITTTMTAYYTAAAASAGPSHPSSSATGSSSPSTPTTPTIPSFNYTGCYSDSTSARVLTGITFADLGPHNVTSTSCAAYCDARGYSIAGTEWGGQCFCGDVLGSGSSKIDESSCAMPCEGNASEVCGGGLALSVFTKEGGGSGNGTSSASGSWKRDAAEHVHFGRLGGMRRHKGRRAV